MDDSRKHIIPLRKRLEKISTKEGIRLDVIQQDYLLTYLLIEIAKSERLKQSLIFKGGTALKKCYFGDYRFSEDLDFTSNELRITDNELEGALQKVCTNLEQTLGKDSPIRLVFHRYVEKHRHPFNQEAFVVRAQFPWQREPLTKVMIEISHEEEIITPTHSLNIINPYDPSTHEFLMTYSLEEVVTEKLRAILQNTKKIHEQGWGRSRVRDYYDLSQILTKFQNKIQWNQISQALLKKCEAKGISLEKNPNFFDPLFVKEAKKSWGQWLAPLSQNIPSCDETLSMLEAIIDKKLLSDASPRQGSRSHTSRR